MTAGADAVAETEVDPVEASRQTLLRLPSSPINTIGCQFPGLSGGASHPAGAKLLELDEPESVIDGKSDAVHGTEELPPHPPRPKIPSRYILRFLFRLLFFQFRKLLDHAISASNVAGFFELGGQLLAFQCVLQVQVDLGVLDQHADRLIVLEDFL